VKCKDCVLWRRDDTVVYCTLSTNDRAYEDIKYFPRPDGQRRQLGNRDCVRDEERRAKLREQLEV